MEISNITVNGELLKLWIEDCKVVGAQSKSTIFLDSYADIEDLINFDANDETLTVIHVEGLSNTGPVDFEKMFTVTEGTPYIAIEQAFEFLTNDQAEIVLKDGEFVAIIFKADHSSICFIKHEDYISVILSLTKHQVNRVYINPAIDFDGSIDMDISIQRLKGVLMETLKSPIAQLFTGNSLITLVMEYGGHSRFQRKKRIRVTQDRLQSVLDTLKRGKPLTEGVRLPNNGILATEAIFRTINRFVPVDAQVNAYTNADELKVIVKEIIDNLDAIKNYKL